MKFNTILFLFVLVLFSCRKIELLRPAPKCIQGKIRHSLNGKGIVLKEVWAEEYADGKKYYFLIPESENDFSEIYDEDCNLMCVKASGTSGVGTGSDCNFNSSIFLRKVKVWEK